MNEKKTLPTLWLAKPRVFAFSHWNTRKVYSHLNNLYSENADLPDVYKNFVFVKFFNYLHFLAE